jgi:hypothetical protein
MVAPNLHALVRTAFRIFGNFFWTFSKTAAARSAKNPSKTPAFNGFGTREFFLRRAKSLRF